MTFYIPKIIVPFPFQQRSPKFSKNVFTGKLQLTLKKKILAPLLFNLYVNDLTGQITEDARIIQYAADCLLSCSHQDPDIALQCLQTYILKLEN